VTALQRYEQLPPRRTAWNEAKRIKDTHTCTHNITGRLQQQLAIKVHLSLSQFCRAASAVHNVPLVDDISRSLLMTHAAQRSSHNYIYFSSLICGVREENGSRATRSHMRIPLEFPLTENAHSFWPREHSNLGLTVRSTTRKCIIFRFAEIKMRIRVLSDAHAQALTAHICIATRHYSYWDTSLCSQNINLEYLLVFLHFEHSGCACAVVISECKTS
jgi:hypothetical protein